jgi:hypothetical protein
MINLRVEIIDIKIHRTTIIGPIIFKVTSLYSQVIVTLSRIYSTTYIRKTVELKTN